MDQPLAVVACAGRAARHTAAQVLSAAGWRVLTAGDAAEALAALDRRPDLMLLEAGLGTVAAIRSGPAASRAIPVLAFADRTHDPETLRTAGFDGVVAQPTAPDALAAAAELWRPDGTAAALDRLAAQFGAAQIDDMVDRLRALFEQALTELDADAVTPLAHRIAGIAGTLGFAAAGRAWLAVSNGEERASDDARRETRRALAAIDRRRE